MHFLYYTQISTPLTRQSTNLDYEKLSVMDKWLLSRLYSSVKAVDENLNNYKIPETAKVLQSFVDDMSNWYVRRSRTRFWAKGMEQDKINAYMTLYNRSRDYRQGGCAG